MWGRSRGQKAVQTSNPQTHAHSHGLRGNSLAHLTPGTQRRGQQPEQKEGKQSPREATRKHTTSQPEIEPGSR